MKNKQTPKQKAEELIGKYKCTLEAHQAKIDALKEANLYLTYSSREDIKVWWKAVIEEIEND